MFLSFGVRVTGKQKEEARMIYVVIDYSGKHQHELIFNLI